MRYSLVMPAAGCGSRFGAGTPKQYLPLAGGTVIEHALAPFLADPRCGQIVVALDADDRWFNTLSVATALQLRTVVGGAERCDSVRNALRALGAGADAWVLVHDAARPCVSRREVDALIETVADDPAGGLLAVPLADTLKRGDAQRRVVATPSRDALWRALTPQMFRLGVLQTALDAAAVAGRQPTDEAQAVEWLGHSPLLVPGSARNLKITTPEDLALAAALFNQRSTGA